ncbi:5-formyltetrahydrofolate cyclo-ligase [Rickettsia typhi]|uniref:5-formyltetrahydrofolate cyclo-ligase n=2 Tax=Rickettsia typhi TaxID=785 RepID=Q68WR8_RICTY|nr:5-formyltetrahydrofolate cyclo-ligase [Rickettsia typhi]AAU03924.1 5,10-methenyltetrahydrofolate synthetase [Rickettsia typhi str. Wilmington]AFE54305.1 5-formyltetrahydrofolate cyclo-ligase [Rickettsia typhi str. TH1527]AFE55145.1 5-formyltetrahydrofolate cyclo-ligase [Rickettsia typhi str. B9991CWPP]
MTKQELRLYFKDLLIKKQDKINSDLVKDALITKISWLLKKLRVNTVGIYYPLKYEINLLSMINLLPEINFYLPKIKNEIKYCAYNFNDALVLGKFKTYEPINNNFIIPELIILPGLAFSKDGYRLGYGKGYFDQYLNNNHKNIFTVGVCLKEQLLDNFPIESHDYKLDLLISV